MCDKAVRDDSSSLQFVPDYFLTQQQLKLWYNDAYYCNEDNFFKWYDGYKKRKAQKSKIREELLPITWHPDCVVNWCMSEDEKRCWK